MKKNIVFTFSVICLVALGTPTFAHEAHEHGTARINLGLEGQRVNIELETPLANLISFEHAPETDGQNEEVRNMAKIMRNAEALFLFPVEAECRLEKVSLKSEAIRDELLFPDGAPAVTGAKAESEKAASPGEKKETEERHADLDAEITFICRQPEKLTRIEVGMFKRFPNLKEMDVQMVTPKGQGAAELTPKANVITW
jgi:hypothetical protein